MQGIILVFVGGGAGAVTRYISTLAAARMFGTAFPWGTLIVNLAGCFLAGIIAGLAGRSEMISPSARLFILAGFLGGLTTFSSFGLETFQAARDGAYWVMILNIIANNVAGLLFVGLGLFLTRHS